MSISITVFQESQQAWRPSQEAEDPNMEFRGHNSPGRRKKPTPHG